MSIFLYILSSPVLFLSKILYSSVYYFYCNFLLDPSQTMSLSRMVDLSYSSSRGRLIDSRLRTSHPDPSCLMTFFKSSAGLDSLASTALRDIGRLRLDPESCRVYFVAGYCDISERLLDCYHDLRPSYGTVTYGRYEEVIFREERNACINRMCQLIWHVSERIKSVGAKPCFSTIPPASLRVWNRKRLGQGKTESLKYENQYEYMNREMVRALQKINGFIVKTNSQNNMSTPHIAAQVMVNQPGYDQNGEKSFPLVHYGRFTDGVHPSPGLADKWAKQLLRAMKSNRGLLPKNPKVVVTPVTTPPSPSHDDSIGSDAEYEMALRESQSECSRYLTAMINSGHK